MKTAVLALAVFSVGWLEPLGQRPAAEGGSGGVAILQVDTDRRVGTIDEKIYGQFLEHINHSVEDGLFAEQIRGGGFEGRDFATYWTPFGSPGAVQVVETRSGWCRGDDGGRVAASVLEGFERPRERPPCLGNGVGSGGYGQGSGVIVREDGYILTNGHVIEDAEKITVRLHDGRVFKGKVRGVDPKSDVAVIKIDAKGVRPIVAMIW